MLLVSAPPRCITQHWVQVGARSPTENGGLIEHLLCTSLCPHVQRCQHTKAGAGSQWWWFCLHHILTAGLTSQASLRLLLCDPGGPPMPLCTAGTAESRRAGSLVSVARWYVAGQCWFPSRLGTTGPRLGSPRCPRKLLAALTVREAGGQGIKVNFLLNRLN